MTKTEEFVCRKSYSLLVVIGICIAPTIITLLLTRFCASKPPNVSFWYCIFMNVSWGIIIKGIICVNINDLWVIALSMLPTFMLMYFIFYYCNICHGGNENCCSQGYVPYEIQLQQRRQMAQSNWKRSCCKNQPEDCCCGPFGCCSNCCYHDCCPEPNDPYGVLRELNSPIVSKEDLKFIITEDIMLPPTPHVAANAYHMGGKNNSQKIVTKTEREAISYGSWQENGEPITIPVAPIVCFRCGTDFEVDNQIETRVAEIRERAEVTMRTYDSLADSYLEHSITGLTYHAVATDESSFVNCCTSCGNRFLIVILMLFGYNYVIEGIWRSKTAHVEFRSKKQISSDKNLRVMEGERDREAANRCANFA